MIQGYLRGILKISLSKGLTLVELLVVIFIISIATALIMPSFWRSQGDEVKSEAKHMSATLRYVYDQAVSKKETYIFRFNLDEDSYSFKANGESRSYQITIHEGLRDIIIPSLGRVSEGEVTVEFGALGPNEPITVHLKDEGIEYTVFFNHLTGRTKIYEGYRL